MRILNEKLQCKNVFIYNNQYGLRLQYLLFGLKFSWHLSCFLSSSVSNVFHSQKFSKTAQAQASGMHCILVLPPVTVSLSVDKDQLCWRSPDWTSVPRLMNPTCPEGMWLRKTVSSEPLRLWIGIGKLLSLFLSSSYSFHSISSLFFIAAHKLHCSECLVFSTCVFYG